MVDGIAPLAGLAGVVARQVRPAVLDAVDLTILQLLASDARMSRRSLARTLSMSPPAVGERISRLERAAVIRGYTIDIGWPEAGFPVTVFLPITAVQGQSLAPVLEASSLPKNSIM